MQRFTTRHALAAVLAGAALLAGCAAPRARSNESLIAAMPDGTESVMVWRLEPLGREQSALKPYVDGFAGMPSEEQPPDGFMVVVRQSIVAADPVVWAHGGSQFVRPPDIGLGNYLERSVWITERPMTHLRRALETGEGIAGPVVSHDAGSVTIYEGPNIIEHYGGETEEERLFVALVDDRTLVWAESLEEAEAMIARLQNGVATIPARWQRASEGLDLAAPLVILRQYDPNSSGDLFSPVNPQNWPVGERIDIEGYGVALDDPEVLTYRFNVVTDDRERALAYYNELLLGDLFTFDREDTASGFILTVRPAPGEQEQTRVEAAFGLVFMFGWHIFV